MLTLEGLGGLVPMLKFGSEMESTLHYANSVMPVKEEPSLDSLPLD